MLGLVGVCSFITEIVRKIVFLWYARPEKLLKIQNILTIIGSTAVSSSLSSFFYLQ